MSTKKLFLEEEEDVVSWASSLSEVHSDEEDESEVESEVHSDEEDEDSTPEITPEAEARWQAQQIEKIHRDLINNYNIQVPDKQQWIASWFEKYQDHDYAAGWSSTRVSYTYQVNLYAYYKKQKRIGGYGVIFRDPGGKPITAASFSSKGGSYLYYLLKGLRKGLRLAIAYDRLGDGVLVRSNSYRLGGIFNQIFSRRRCRHHRRLRPPQYKRKKVCQECTQHLFYGVKRREFKRLYDIVEDIMKMSEGFKFSDFKSDYLFDTVHMCRSGNQAAYYMAKHFKNKSEMEPQEFPHVLREIIWKDAYEGYMAYSETSWMMQFRQRSREAQPVTEMD